MSNDRYASDTNQRRARRQPVAADIKVTDVITGAPIGRIGNLSRGGLMLITPQPLTDNALYQLSFELPGRGGRGRHMEVGLSEQWCESAAMPGQYWSGMRFIAISDDDDEALEHWLHEH